MTDTLELPLPVPEAIVWFDGDCPLCAAEIGLLRRLDRGKGRLAFVNLRGGGACPLDRDAMLARFHAQARGQPVVSGVSAFAVMWRRVTPFQPLGWLAALPGAGWLLEPLYNAFLAIRPWLAGLAAGRKARAGLDEPE